MDTILWYKSFMDAAQGLSVEDRCAFYEAVMHYGFTGEQSTIPDTLPEAASGLFRMAKTMLDEAKRRREQKMARDQRKERRPMFDTEQARAEKKQERSIGNDRY